MEVILENAGKRYQREWIFRNLSYTLQSGNSYAITGRNGSGKSTLALLLIGQLIPTEGKVFYRKSGNAIDEHNVYQNTAMAAPYLELIEEFTVSEMIEFHFRMKKKVVEMTENDILEYAWLTEAAGKQIKQLSSGMKQRLKLSLAFLSDCPLLVLDEPTSNLDTHGVDWYLDRLQSEISRRLTVICSNQSYEYEMCTHNISVEDFK
jgi:ABC-type multidrug transport system ATPase subunit